jgi:hypothetical protein
MAVEPRAQAGRRRSFLLILLGIVVVVLVVSRSWTHFSAQMPALPSNQAAARRGAPADDQVVDPQELDVRIEALEAPRPDRGGVARDPFRFQSRAAPSSPAPSSSTPPPSGPPPPPPIPPIPLKLMGFVDVKGGQKLAALSDCKGGTWSAREGQVVDGRYRVIKIGLESVVIEYVDGKGRQTLRVDGCPPR